MGGIFLYRTEMGTSRDRAMLEKSHIQKRIFYRSRTMLSLFSQCSVTVEPLNKDTFGTSRFVLCREVVLFEFL